MDGNRDNDTLGYIFIDFKKVDVKAPSKAHPKKEKLQSKMIVFRRFIE